MESVFNLCKLLIELGKIAGLQKKIDVYYANNRLNDEEYSEICKLLTEV